MNIWNEQCIISSSVYSDLQGDMPKLYAKVLTNSDVITYKVKVSYTASNGKKMSKWEVRTIPEADIKKIKASYLYRVMQIVIELKPFVWDHIMDIDAGSNISTYTKKPISWTNLCSKHIGNYVNIPSDLLTSGERVEMTPGMVRTLDTANSYHYEIWHDLNIWGKDTGLISPKETAFMGSIYFWCKRGKELTYKQSRYALNILEKARAAGWEE